MACHTGDQSFLAQENELLASYYQCRAGKELGTGCEKMQVLVPVLSLASCVTCPLSEPPFLSSAQLLITLAAL